jgi:hypothetical protein
MVAKGKRIWIGEECLLLLLEVLVWLMEAGHDVQTTAGGRPSKTRDCSDSACSRLVRM